MSKYSSSSRPTASARNYLLYSNKVYIYPFLNDVFGLMKWSEWRNKVKCYVNCNYFERYINPWMNSFILPPCILHPCKENFIPPFTNGFNKQKLKLIVPSMSPIYLPKWSQNTLFFSLFSLISFLNPNAA